MHGALPSCVPVAPAPLNSTTAPLRAHAYFGANATLTVQVAPAVYTVPTVQVPPPALVKSSFSAPSVRTEMLPSLPAVASVTVTGAALLPPTARGPKLCPATELSPKAQITPGTIIET